MDLFLCLLTKQRFAVIFSCVGPDVSYVNYIKKNLICVWMHESMYLYLISIILAIELKLFYYIVTTHLLLQQFISYNIGITCSVPNLFKL